MRQRRGHRLRGVLERGGHDLAKDLGIAGEELQPRLTATLADAGGQQHEADRQGTDQGAWVSWKVSVTVIVTDTGTPLTRVGV